MQFPELADPADVGGVSGIAWSGARDDGGEMLEEEGEVGNGGVNFYGGNGDAGEAGLEKGYYVVGEGIVGVDEEDARGCLVRHALRFCG